MKESIGYFIINHTFFKEAKDELQLCLDSFASPEPRCIAILGPSGCGKSTMIDDFIKNLGPSKDPRKKMVLVIETPTNPTVRAMASEVLQTIGDPHYTRGTEVSMTQRILLYIKELGIQFIIFDEFQNLIDKDSDKLCFKAADWVKRLRNKGKIPIAIAGLERTEEIFLINKQLRKRFKESYFIKPFDWNNKSTQNLLKGFLMAVHKKYCFEEGIEIFSHEMAFRFYSASGGLVGYIMDIVREAQRLADLKHSHAIGREHLILAYSKAVCCNSLVGVNPFSENDLEKLKLALKVVEDTKATKRKDKTKTKPE